MEMIPMKIKKVVLYKHGVGYFERSEKVNDNEEIELFFSEKGMNDVLKSLIILDKNGGTVSGVSYDSTQSTERLLEEMSFDIKEHDSLTSLLAQTRGAKVAVTVGADIIEGVVVGIQTFGGLLGNDIITSDIKGLLPQLNLLTDGGGLQSFALPEIKEIKVLDSNLLINLRSYLETLFSVHNKGLRKLTISAEGQGEREVIASYVLEAPVWKTTYRVVLPDENNPFIQGWALVDNPSDEDWDNVDLSLISGMPISFTLDLLNPRYMRRHEMQLDDQPPVEPMIPEESVRRVEFPELEQEPDEEESLLLAERFNGVREGIIQLAREKPEMVATILEMWLTDDEAREGLRKAAIVLSTLGMEDKTLFKSVMLHVNSEAARDSLIHEIASGSAKVAPDERTEALQAIHEIISQDIYGSTVAPLELIGDLLPSGSSKRKSEMLNSILRGKTRVVDSTTENVEDSVDTITKDMGEFFEYKIAHPVTVKQKQSALVTIVQSDIDTRKVLLYNPETMKSNPSTCLEICNTTGLTLEGGPLVVIEGNTYVGEAMVELLKPNEKRLVPYAVELGCTVSVTLDTHGEGVTFVKIQNGMMETHLAEVWQTTYIANNKTKEPKQLYIEHEILQEKLFDTPEPVERTARYYRFKVDLEPQNSTDFRIKEKSTLLQTYQLTTLAQDELSFFIEKNFLNQSTADTLAKIVALRAKIAERTESIKKDDEERKAIYEDQERLRENLKSLGDGQEERKLKERIVAKLSEQEDKLENLQSSVSDKKQEKSKMQDEMDEILRTLEFEVVLKSEDSC